MPQSAHLVKPDHCRPVTDFPWAGGSKSVPDRHLNWHLSRHLNRHLGVSFSGRIDKTFTMATHTVSNQPPALADYNAWQGNPLLTAAVAREGGGWIDAEAAQL